jgi:hypothetical protein
MGIVMGGYRDFMTGAFFWKRFSTEYVLLQRLMGRIERLVQENAACLFTDAGFPVLFF